MELGDLPYRTPAQKLEAASADQIAAIKKQQDAKTMKRRTPTEANRLVRRQIMDLRMKGLGWLAIGEIVGLSAQTVYQHHLAAMKSITDEPSREVRLLELKRLDAMLESLHESYAKFFPVVNSGQVIRDVVEDEDGNPVLREDGRPVTFRLEDVGPRLQILDRMLKIQERRSKLLGLDAPVRRTLEGTDGGPVKFDHTSLKGLSDNELAVMVTLMEKATGNDSEATASGS